MTSSVRRVVAAAQLSLLSGVLLLGGILAVAPPGGWNDDSLGPVAAGTHRRGRSRPLVCSLDGSGLARWPAARRIGKDI